MDPVRAIRTPPIYRVAAGTTSTTLPLLLVSVTRWYRFPLSHQQPRVTT